MRMRKPEIQAYRFVMKKTGLKPNEILFIDDKTRNVKPAKTLGWNVIVYRNFTQIKKELKTFGF